MTDLIKGISRRPNRLIINFYYHDGFFQSLELIIQKVIPHFELKGFRKYTNQKWLDDWYEGKLENTKFLITLKHGIVKVRFEGGKELIEKLIREIIGKYTYSKKPKTRYNRR